MKNFLINVMVEHLQFDVRLRRGQSVEDCPVEGLLRIGLARFADPEEP